MVSISRGSDRCLSEGPGAPAYPSSCMAPPHLSGPTELLQCESQRMAHTTMVCGAHVYPHTVRWGRSFVAGSAQHSYRHSTSGVVRRSQQLHCPQRQCRCDGSIPSFPVALNAPPSLHVLPKTASHCTAHHHQQQDSMRCCVASPAVPRDCALLVNRHQTRRFHKD